MTTLTPRERFEQDGFIVLPQLLSPTAVQHYKATLAMYAPSGKTKWTLADGLVQTPEFWPLIFDQQLRSTLSNVFDGPFKFLQHNDLHVGFSSFTWHRDSVNRKFGIGGDWEESEVPYRLARVAIYLQEASSGFRLGLIRGSHRPDKWLSPVEQRELKRRTSGLANALSAVSGKDLLADRADWVATEPGDAIIFDPRIVHTGSEFSGRKFSVFLAFGEENRHFHRHYRYYRHLRRDLGYKDFPEALAHQLQAAGLHPDELPNSSTPIEGAWMPSGLFTAIAKQFK
ncbi:MAG: phytanoyl-CoA dioxygenase family protein [Bacteroidota bacterium]